MLWGACVRPIGWWNRSWGLFVPGFVGGFRTDWVGSWSGDRLSIINDINDSVFWCTIGDKSQGLWINYFTMVDSDSCILKCRNVCGQCCYAMMMLWCTALLQGLVHVCHLELKPRASGLSMVSGKTCIHKHMHIRLCLIEFAAFDRQFCKLAAPAFCPTPKDLLSIVLFSLNTLGGPSALITFWREFPSVCQNTSKMEGLPDHAG